MTLGFILAYFFKAPLWQRVAVFVSSVPVSILMNSFRVGMIGVMVEYWGTDVADGFLHDFQGWVVFLASAGVLVAEMLLLAWFGGDRRPWREVLGIEFPAPSPRGYAEHLRRLPQSLLVTGVVFLAGATALAAVPERIGDAPERRPLSLFPRSFEDWRGSSAILDEVYVDALLVDDYLVIDYRRDESAPTNLYVAWYDAQRAGQSVHSPRSCIPGGGWQITSLERRSLPGVQVGGQPLAVNRVLIQYDDQQQLVYYWFQQRGRVVTNEYAVKWYLLVDALRRNRTDGALVRLVTPIVADEDRDQADARLTALATAIAPRLPEFVPN
jgi:exosortase D (VPLPA-CTERM-specific)